MKKILIPFLFVLFITQAHAQCPYANKVVDQLTIDTESTVVVQNPDGSTGSIKLPKYFDYDLLRLSITQTFDKFGKVVQKNPWQAQPKKGYYATYFMDTCSVLMFYNASQKSLYFLYEPQTTLIKPNENTNIDSSSRTK